jgi:hypothetical protein
LESSGVRLGRFAFDCQRTPPLARLFHHHVGAGGQTQTKVFVDESAALAHTAKLIDEKTAKGYLKKSGPS